MLRGIIEKASSVLKFLGRNRNKCDDLGDKVFTFELGMSIEIQQASDRGKG